MFAFTRPIATTGANRPVTPLRRIAVCTICVFLFLLNLTAKAEDDDAVIQRSIEAQLEAFRSGDAQRAFSFASDQIRDIFGTPENFIAMVRSQYAVMIAPTSIVFLKLEHENGATLQPVQLSDDHGQLWLAVYSMQLDAQGSWRINGCVLRQLHGNSTKRPRDSPANEFASTGALSYRLQELDQCGTLVFRHVPERFARG